MYLQHFFSFAWESYYKSIGRILNANSSWICQLNPSLSVVLPQSNLTKLKLEYLKFGFRCKKERYKHRRKKFASLEFNIFRVQLNFAFSIRRNEN